uniref:DUF1616 domain-containing protein n=2 Tax=Candidatus Methanogaster sp. ANME-2c ERB4 TaxID=2759911 RepID=A0A7G9Y3Q0_9EURY|nr:hypothetical protein DMCHJJFE_00006 [Methanosarcinales archaeon ANME-2c ERB4]QNO42634.1 hypothetical protein KPMFPNGI_00036 [Methanosarcinales archaeon ANME-2c ERB4]QNO42855.1 hypothetical protein JEGCCDFC_00002 [Methanosarcinales archaeon ANME-2c ERB4]
MSEKFQKDPTLVIIFTFFCILFVIVSQHNEIPVRMVLGLLFVLFLPRYSLIAKMFLWIGNLGWIERIVIGLGVGIAIVVLIGLGLNYTQYRILMVPLLIEVSLFTILLVLVEYVRNGLISEGERFVVEGVKMQMRKLQ